ncbi:MAG: hypothetical protein ACRD96_08760 [Bryobacteraceae bacterium]
MISLNYSKDVVLTIFFQENGKVDPTAAELQQTDANLMAAFETILVEIMTEEEIETRKDKKSQVLLNSRFASGAGPRQKIRKACKFFKNTEDL